MEIVLSIFVGVGLSAACGFRVFVPLLIMSVAARAGHIHLSPEFNWIASNAALIAFGMATVLEIAGYYIPVVDNLLDAIATPAAVVAGVLVSASMIAEMSPFLKWTLAVILGGGVAAGVQGATVLARAASTSGTGGLANPVLATAELGASLLTSVSAILVPLLAVTLIIILLTVAAVAWRRRKVRNAASEAG
jgi:hypothetical protein